MHSFMLAVASSGGAALAGTRGNGDPAVAIALLMLIAFGGLAIGLLARLARHSQEDDDGDSGSGGGGGPRRPTPRPRPGGDSVWWPEFAAPVCRVCEKPEPGTLNDDGRRFSGFPYPAAPVKRP